MNYTDVSVLTNELEDLEELEEIYTVFSDIENSTYYYDSVIHMHDIGVIRGYDDGLFYPTNCVTLAEVLTMLFNIAGVDVPTATEGENWYTPVMTLAVNYGIIYDDMEYDKILTRYDVAYYIVKLYNLTKVGSDYFVDIDDYVVNSVYEKGIFTGVKKEDGLYFNGTDFIKRCDMAIVLCNLETIDSLFDGSLYFGSYEISKNPIDKSDFEELFSYLKESNLTKVSVPYSLNISNYGFYKQLTDTIYSTYLSCFAKDISYYCYYNNVTITRSVNSNGSGVLTISLDSDNFTADEIIEMQKEVNINIIEDMSEVYGDFSILELNELSDYERLAMIFEFVVRNVEYDKKEGKESFVTYGAQVNDKAVCQGYTAYFNKLCESMGYKVEGVSGMLTQTLEPHIWSRIFIAGNWYYFDTTFADVIEIIEFQEETIEVEYCDFEYFMCSFDEIMVGRIGGV